MEGRPVQTMQGTKARSLVYHCGDGFFYIVRERRPGNLRLKCRQYRSGCQGTSSVHVGTGILQHLNYHSHPPDLLLPADLEMRREIVNDAGTNFTGETPRQVLQRWKLRCNNADLGKRFTMPRMRSSIAKARSDNYPNIPRTLFYLGILLGLPDMRAVCLTADGTDMIFRGLCGVQAHKTVSVVFVSMRMLQFLSSRKNLHLDGTFKKRPKKPASMQMFNIVTNYDGHVVAMVRVLMMRRTGMAYRALFQYLEQLCPNLNPQRVHCDFERALMNVLKETFPLPCRVVGCLWHYGVAFSSQARSYGLAELAKEDEEVFELIRCFCALPMLPYHRIEEGLEQLWTEIQDLGWGEQFRLVNDYFRAEWLPRSSELTVYAQPERTNNCSESDNHSLANVLPKNRPNIWQLILGFVQLEWLAWQDVQSIRAGIVLHGPRRWSAIWNDRRIMRFSERLDTGEMSCFEFLHAASWHVLAPARHGLHMRQGDAPESESD